VLYKDAAKLPGISIVVVVHQAVNVGDEDLCLELERKSVLISHIAFYCNR